jgi:ERCC4-related helicase
MLTLRQYQRTAVKSAVVHFAFNQRGLLVSPAGSGKTVIAASILKDSKSGQDANWLAPTVETKDQGRKACETVGVADVTCACFQGQPDLTGYEWVVYWTKAACGRVRHAPKDAGRIRWQSAWP